MDGLSALLDHVMDLLTPMGGVTARAMFGGHGIYRHGTVFGMLVKDALYLKADEANRETFISRGLPAFSYASKSGQKVAMSYFQAPAEALDDGDEMVRWALCSYEAALRGKTSNARPRKLAVAGRKNRRSRGGESGEGLATFSPPSAGTLGRATSEMTARLNASSPPPALVRQNARVRATRR